MTTLKQLRDAAKRVDCLIEADEDCQCYRATAPPGRRWEPGLHELVAVFGGGILGNDGTRAGARADLLRRIEEYGYTETCDDAVCDWCRS